jgi:hypothetical protein
MRHIFGKVYKSISRSLAEMEEPDRKTTVFTALHLSLLYGRETLRKK